MSELKKQGIVFAILAYGLWGFLPMYFKVIEQVSPAEIVVHRVIWSFFFTLALILMLRRWQKVKDVFAQPKYLWRLVLSSALVSGNWLLYIWAVNNDRILDGSLGYYINPIVNIILGMAFLQERLRPVQWFAVGLAVFGVAVELVAFGEIPWIALTLAVTFSTYGLIRKQIPVDAQTGLFLETAVLLSPALVYLLFFVESTTGNLLANTWQLNSLLLLAGPFTSVPLILFAAAAQRLNYSTMGFFQYIAPSIMFGLAIGVYGETFTLQKGITFLFIWAALAVFSLDALRWQRQQLKFQS